MVRREVPGAPASGGLGVIRGRLEEAAPGWGLEKGKGPGRRGKEVQEGSEGGVFGDLLGWQRSWRLEGVPGELLLGFVSPPRATPRGPGASWLGRQGLFIPWDQACPQRHTRGAQAPSASASSGAHSPWPRTLAQVLLGGLGVPPSTASGLVTATLSQGVTEGSAMEGHPVSAPGMEGAPMPFQVSELGYDCFGAQLVP